MDMVDEREGEAQRKFLLSRMNAWVNTGATS